MNYLILVFTFIILIISNTFGVNQADIDFYYKNGQYQQALDVYKTVLDKRYNDPDLLYNIGNVYYKLDKYGYAMGYYLHALKLNPYDADLKANIKLLKSKITQSSDIKDESNQLMDYLFFRWISINHSFLIFFILFIGSVSLFAYRFIQKKKFKVYGICLFSLCFFFFTIFALKYYDIEIVDRGVILSDKTSVYSGPSEVLSVLFLLDKGSNFQLVQDQQEWVEIMLNNGFRGWVKRSDYYSY